MLQFRVVSFHSAGQVLVISEECICILFFVAVHEYVLGF
jgi:hypothetical protein